MAETPSPAPATRGGDGPLGPFLIVLGLLAIFAGGFVYVQSRQTTGADEAGDAIAVIAGRDTEEREPNTVALAAGVGGGSALILVGVLVLSSERKHRETLAAIERAAAPPA